MIRIAPSILNADFSRLAQQVEALETGGADWVHLDIMDGHFVPNLTFGPMIVAAVRRITALPLDVHLMISRPDDYIAQFVEAGADYLTVHVEAAPHLWRTLENIHALGAKPGVTLNPATPVTALEPVLPLVDLVLVMSVEPGFGGQRYLAAAQDRLRQLKQWRSERGLSYLIEVDGGIDAVTAVEACNAGAEVLVIGQAIFHQKDLAEAVRQMRRVLSG
ncbi:MAG TPA: ribulose-phosphate 3-epimerase [bacterium]|nr:ribulose-phosphate 3-epimerase [bacterium]HQG47085.1 ribulose-phosphate 3-epimerase [bacterium]HQI49554.1 ribulose-phosphate 3-epimerase [bacterium]HQJ65556.1 ribulose-phosphate 3-epimerase [bacterium]